MKAVKFIAQVLSALIYSQLYTGIMYFVFVLPFCWILTLSTWKMLFAIVFLGGIIETLTHVIQIIGLFPFKWIVKDNKISFVVSVALCGILPLFNIYSLWHNLLGHGTLAVITAVIFTIMLLRFVYISVLALFSLKETDSDVNVSNEYGKKVKVENAQRQTDDMLIDDYVDTIGMMSPSEEPARDVTGNTYLNDSGMKAILRRNDDGSVSIMDESGNVAYTGTEGEALAALEVSGFKISQTGSGVEKR